MTMSSSSDTLTGSISVLDKTGQHQTVTLNKTSVTSLESTLSGYGITTGVANDVLTFSATGGDTDTPAIYGPSITENTASASTIGVTPRSVLGTLAVNNADDTFTAGSLSGVKSNGSTTWSLDLTGQTIGGLESALASDGISANLSGNTLTFTAASGTPTITGSDITDTTPLNTPVNLTNTPAASSTNSASVGSLTFNNTDTLSGSLKIGSQTININSSDNTASTLEQIIDNGSYGVKASYNSTSGVMNFTSSNSALQMTLLRCMRRHQADRPRRLLPIPLTILFLPAITASEYPAPSKTTLPRSALMEPPRMAAPGTWVLLPTTRRAIALAV
jgi:hypothetical protein